MSEKTNIAWCDSTWNWVIGCTKVSPGCANCYAEVSMPSKMFGVGWGDKGERRVAADATFNAPLKWNKKPWVCDECGLAHPKNVMVCKCGSVEFHRRRVFSLSLGDCLDPKIPVPVLARALDIIRRCPGIDFLLCTKRPELFPQRLCDVCNWRKATGEGEQSEELFYWVEKWLDDKAPHNVWVLTSVEDQQRADERIPHLLRIPAVVRGLSVEPMLEDLKLMRWFAQCRCGHGHGFTACPNYGGVAKTCHRCACKEHKPAISWAIIGGESGPKARPCNVEWVRSIVRQCQQANAPCFVKQIGARPVEDIRDARGKYCGYQGLDLNHPKGGDPPEWPADLRVREFPTAKSP